jgi:hypothetical protein
MTKEIVYWKMRDGNLISVDDMTEEHAKNVLKIVLKNRQTVIKQIVKSKRTNFMLHGDMANEFNENHLSDEDDDRFEDLFDESLLNL